MPIALWHRICAITMPSPTLQDEAQTVMRKKLTNGTGNRSSHVALFLFIAFDEHDRGRFDIAYPLRQATNPVNAYVGWEGICFSSTARSMFVGVLPHTCLDGQAVGVIGRGY